MLFDIRGRRKHVVRVVYAILALLMGASLLLVVGPFNIGEIVGGGGSSSSKIFDEQAERIERKLVKSPHDETLLLTLTRARINAGNAQLEVDETTGSQTITVDAVEEFGRAANAWSRYLKEAGGKPNPSVALLAANTYFSLAQAANSFDEALADLHKAAEAQRFVATARPTLNSLSTLAIYEYYAGDFAAGDKATKKAEGLAASKAQAKSVKTQMAEYRKRGKQIQKQKREVAKAEQGKGREALENPLGLGGSAGP